MVLVVVVGRELQPPEAVGTAGIDRGALAVWWFQDSCALTVQEAKAGAGIVAFAHVPEAYVIISRAGDRGLEYLAASWVLLRRRLLVLFCVFYWQSLRRGYRHARRVSRAA